MLDGYGPLTKSMAPLGPSFWERRQFIDESGGPRSSRDEADYNCGDGKGSSSLFAATNVLQRTVSRVSFVARSWKCPRATVNG